jgi:hypothetical protein
MTERSQKARDEWECLRDPESLYESEDEAIDAIAGMVPGE